MAPLLKIAREHPTLVVVLLCGALLATILALVASTRSSNLTTVTGITREVDEGLDDILDRLPTDAVVSSTRTESRESCPDGTHGAQVTVERRFALDPAFDAPSWTTATREAYAAEDGWTASLKTLSSRDHVRLTLVGRPLIIYRLSTGSPERPDELIARATSRCSTE
jgi:hypothetical protein